MKSVKRLSRYTSILLSMLLMLSAMSPGLTALAQEKANAAPAVLTYEDDSITAELKATEGTSLPAGAALNVKALNKDSQDEAEKALYAQTEAGLNAKASEQGTTVDGFTAYSVKLQNKEGKDMTPAQGEYTLKVTYKEATAPEAFLNSESAEKGVTLYQKTEGKDEQNNTIYTMEVTGEEDTKITADANGKVQAVESMITTLQPIALAWQSVTQAETGNVTAEVSEPEALSSDPSERNTNETGGAGQTLKDNQVRFKFHANNQNWSEQDQYFSNWIVNIVDEKGNSLAVKESNETISLNLSNQVVSIADVAANIELEGYRFNRASVTGYANFQNVNYEKYNEEERDFTSLIVWKSGNEPYQYQYKQGNTSFGRDRINRDGDTYNNHATVTFVFTKVTPLTEIETVDSVAEGVDIQMFDYSEPTPLRNWGDYSEGGKTGNIKEGLVKRVLGKTDNNELIPVSARNASNNQGKSIKKGDFLTDSFSTINNANYKGKANHLFSQSIFTNPETRGTFSYSSFDNYAYWNEGGQSNDTRDFTVYNQIGTPSDQSWSGNERLYFYQRGNFMPYNRIEAGKLSANKNLYDENGVALKSEDSRYNEDLYKTQQSAAAAKGDNGNDYYFGMVVTANFAQLKDGQYNGKPMVYEFNGDDDMWVFIDGVLVLDIGGIHDAHSGSIDFSTGDVVWYDSVKGGKPEGNSTTIKEQFEAAERAEKDNNVINWNTVKWADNKNTFADYTNHEIKIFYMERGGGASNCKMKFNLPVVPKGSVTVRKEIDNINEGSYSDVNFNFKLYVEDQEADENSADTIKDADGVKYSARKGQPYTLKDDNVTEEKSGQTDENTGIFTLRHGQQVRFDELDDMNTKYIIEEIDADEELYDKFTVNGEAQTVEQEKIESTTEEGKFVLRTRPLAIGTDLWVVVQNHCTATNFKNIEITKQMVKGQKSDEDYKFRVTVGGQLYKAKYIISGESEEKQCEDGIITLKARQTATIKGIPSGTTFNVEEIELDDSKYDSPKFTVTGADINSSGDRSVSGTVNINHNSQITITNTLKLGSLKITKTITDDSKVDYMDGDPIFTFKITGPNNIDGQEPQVFYRTLRLSEDVGKTASITIDNLPIGEYTVEELNTMRYTCTSDNPQTDTVQQNNTEETKNTLPTEFSFTNKLTNEDYFSHTDVVENSFKIGEDGTVTVEKHKVPEGQVPDGTTPVQPSNE